jgi:hypothetical protein
MPQISHQTSRYRETHLRAKLDLPLTSLLWPAGYAPKPADPANWEADLGLGEIVNALSLNGRYTSYIRQVLTTLITDADTIQWRQSVMADFTNNPTLVERSLDLLPRLSTLQQSNTLLGRRQRNLLLETADHLTNLEAYVGITRDLHTTLEAANLQSSALIKLRHDLAAFIAEPNFQTLENELPELRAPLQDIRSLTIGLNLDVELKPESAVILSINNHKCSEKQSWLDRVIGTGVDSDGETGIAALHRVPDDPNMRPLSPLFQDLDRLLQQIAQPVARALSKYTRMGSGSLSHLEFELAFFAGAAQMITRLKTKAVPVCLPEIAPFDDRCLDICGLVNIGLALRAESSPVPSDAQFDETGRIAILTGPNSGGKTTYVRALGLAVVLFQAGLPVPAESVRMSPVDQILAHFPALESRQEGRLAEEALRLRRIFQYVTRHSLVLLNETFSSTASGEAVFLAQDVLAALRTIGARVIYATHLLELSEHIEEIESLSDGDCKLFSLVAGTTINDAGEASPTYQITRGSPHGRSYARDIARKHGISLEQILSARQADQ